MCGTLELIKKQSWWCLGTGGLDEKASERVSPDYRMMRDGWKVRQKKQLGPSAMLFLEHGTTDNVGTSKPFMFTLKVPVRAAQAPTCLTPSLLTTSASAASVCTQLLWH